MNSGRSYRHRFRAMASACEVLLSVDDPLLAQHAAQAVEAEVRRIEIKYSRYRADSVISRINAAAGAEFVDIDEETCGLLDYAAVLWEQSSGAFDPTAGVLRKLWDFGQPRLPEPAAVSALLALVGWNKLERRPDRVRLSLADMQLDFGGFGKEYACDRAAGVLAGLGLRGSLVNLGGDVRVLGPPADRAAWTIGIQHPRLPGASCASIELESGALATSGDYQRFFELDGRRYCHILDPRSGWPVADCAQSVSVLAPLCLVAGSATTLALLAGEQGHHLLEGREFLWIAADGTARSNSSRFVPTNESGAQSPVANAGQLPAADALLD